MLPRSSLSFRNQCPDHQILQGKAVRYHWHYYSAFWMPMSAHQYTPDNSRLLMDYKRLHHILSGTLEHWTVSCQNVRMPRSSLSFRNQCLDHQILQGRAVRYHWHYYSAFWMPMSAHRYTPRSSLSFRNQCRDQQILQGKAVRYQWHY
jgi:uncharacterized SAM-binding protein YcdF (DUF218 family)